jgi:pimeloyl-ACP methyl ester carboxylesterase
VQALRRPAFLARALLITSSTVLLSWSKPSLDPTDSSEAELASCHVTVDDGVVLRVLRWTPAAAPTKPPLLFVAGWVSSVEGWVPMLRRLVRDREVYYLESREKSSARIDRSGLTPDDFSIERNARDLRQVVDALEIVPEDTVIMGSSLGATSILEALKADRIRARGALLIGPNSSFRFPLWGKVLVHSPASSYHVIKILVLFYLRHFRVDVKNEPQQMERYDRTLRTANPLRMKLSAMAVQNYEVWDGLDTVSTPVAVAYSPTDKLHSEDEIKRMAKMLPRGRLVPCPTNRSMHGEDIVAHLDGFISSDC